jgi:hypothetical protein
MYILYTPNLDKSRRIVTKMFKKGDEVECVRAFTGKVTLGKLYIVDEDSKGEYTRVKDDEGKIGGWYHNRFRLVKPAWQVKVKKARPPAIYPGLYKQAKELEIVGRSRMNIAQLKEAIKGADNTLEVELRKQVGDNGGVCSFAYQRKNGEKVYWVRDVCHARIPHRGNCVKLVLDIGGHYAQAQDKQLVKDFYQYVLNESPWASLFLTKNVDKALKFGVLVDVQQPISRIMSGAVTLRHAGEPAFCARLPTWQEFRKLGLSDNLAWFATQGFHRMNKDSISGFDEWHDTFGSTQSLAGVVKFFKEGFHENLGEGPYAEYRGYDYVVCRAVTKSGGESLRSFFDKNMKHVLLGTGWNAVLVLDKNGWKEALVPKVKELFK